jgi:hypothetical protein
MCGVSSGEKRGTRAVVIKNKKRAGATTKSGESTKPERMQSNRLKKKGGGRIGVAVTFRVGTKRVESMVTKRFRHRSRCR